MAQTVFFGKELEPIQISLISFASIFTGAMIGFFCGRVLPETHMTHESKEAVKIGWGIVATMSALVLQGGELDPLLILQGLMNLD